MCDGEGEDDPPFVIRSFFFLLLFLNEPPCIYSPPSEPPNSCFVIRLCISPWLSPSFSASSSLSSFLFSSLSYPCSSSSFVSSSSSTSFLTCMDSFYAASSPPVLSPSLFFVCIKIGRQGRVFGRRTQGIGKSDALPPSLPPLLLCGAARLRGGTMLDISPTFPPPLPSLFYALFNLFPSRHINFYFFAVKIACFSLSYSCTYLPSSFPLFLPLFYLPFSTTKSLAAPAPPSLSRFLTSI